jgi:hypothetical protein
LYSDCEPAELVDTVVNKYVNEVSHLVQGLEGRVEKREDCRKQADAQKLGPLERVQFVRKCLE